MEPASASGGRLGAVFASPSEADGIPAVVGRVAGLAPEDLLGYVSATFVYLVRNNVLVIFQATFRESSKTKEIQLPRYSFRPTPTKGG